MSVWGADGNYAPCGEGIAEAERWLLHHIDHPQGHNEDMQFHDLCHDTWLERAATQ